MIINRIYEYQNLLLPELVSFLVGLRTYQHPCSTQTYWTQSITIYIILTNIHSPLRSLRI
jgi:hypothetical protein